MSTFSQVLLQSFHDCPEKVAVRLLYSQQPEQALTYRLLVERAATYAHRLEQAGVRPGEVVILILPTGEELVYSFFGAVLHGAIPSILPFLTEKLSLEVYRESLAALFAVTAPAAAITYPEFVEEVRAAAAGSSLRAVLVSGKNDPVAPPDVAAAGGLACSPDDIVLLQHSSGTTGLQKGVALSHRAVFNQLGCYSRALRLSPEDVIVSWLPLYHDMGLIAGFLLPVLSRAPLVLMSPFDWVRAPYKLLQAISRFHGTLCWMPNFAYNFCAQKIRERDLEGVDLSSLRALINCSEPVHWKSHQAFLERFSPLGFRPEALATCYAMAENVFAVTQGGIDAPLTVDRVNERALLTRQEAEPAAAGDPNALPVPSCGRPVENTRLRVLDPQGRDLPERHLGEIVVQSNCMLTGYYHRPDATEKAFLDGWFLTGDLGYLANGELYVTGRKKDLIIVGGKNVYPQDLERLAGEVTGVHPGRVVAFGVYDEAQGTEEVVVIAEAEDAGINPQAAEGIADEIRRRVTRGSDVALRRVRVVERGWLLKTSSGKIARAANRDKFLNEEGN